MQSSGSSWDSSSRAMARRSCLVCSAAGLRSHSPLRLSAGLIELVAGTLVAVGFCGRAAAFLASGEMAVAYFMVCAGRGFSPITNGGETAVLYCFVFLYIFFHGSGLWSLDALWRRAHDTV